MGSPTQSNIKSLEQIQKRAARFVTNDYQARKSGCVTRMQEYLGWDTLQKRRLENRLSMLNRIDHQLVDVKKENYLQSGGSRTRGGHKFYQERTSSEVYRNSFFPRTVIDWNKLPHSVTAATSLEEFRECLCASPTTNYTTTVNNFKDVLLYIAIWKPAASVTMLQTHRAYNVLSVSVHPSDDRVLSNCVLMYMCRPRLIDSGRTRFYIQKKKM